MTDVARPGYAAVDRPEQLPDRGVALPDRRLFWRWVWQAVRPVVGWVLAALGALALFLGWYGVSGEALTAKQLPYLVSGGLTGIGLIVMAGVFLATEDIRHQLRRVDDLERKLDDLYSLFVADIAAAGATPAAGSTLSRVSNPLRADPLRAGSLPAESLPAADAVVALPSGSSYHRPDCSLVAGKDETAEVDAATIERRRLKACRVCDPTPPAAG